LGELVCADWNTYVGRAVALARDRGVVARLRERLLAGRMASTLFDTAGLVRALEDLYRGIWRDAQVGNLPVPELTNLDAYLEIGSGFDFDDAEPEAAAMQDARWRAALARRHAYSPLPPDRRLWPAPDAALALAAE